MGLFDFGPKRVTEREHRYMRPILRGKGKFTDRDFRDLDKIVSGHMSEEGRHKGLSSEEIKRTAEWMRKNKSKHSLSEEQINFWEEEARKRL